MPCYQAANLPSGVTTSGRPAYQTEAECLQACKEGACCEGTTCTVKPQCQCQCATGSCCGPDTYTNITGEAGPRCRTETQEQCAARGGVWRCGVSCRPLGYDPYAGYTTGSEICNSYDATPSATPVFKGVGTTCAGNPCMACYECLAIHPSYVTVSFSQTAPITGGFLESVINLSGSYSVPSVSTSSVACQFCGSFSKTYPNALPSNFINRDMVVTFRVTVAFASQTKAVAIVIYGTALDANEIGSRAPGLYQFAVMTGEVGGLSFSGCAYGGAAQMQSFANCSGNSHIARQRGWTNSPTSQYPYRIEYNQTTVECGTLSWSQ